MLTKYTPCIWLQVSNLLKEVEIVFVPFVNPDGYEVNEWWSTLHHKMFENY